MPQLACLKHEVDIASNVFKEHLSEAWQEHDGYSSAVILLRLPEMPRDWTKIHWRH